MEKKTTNPRRMTFQESGVTIQPYKSMPSPEVVKCIRHVYTEHSDAFGHKWLQCKQCGKLR